MKIAKNKEIESTKNNDKVNEDKKNDDNNVIKNKLSEEKINLSPAKRFRKSPQSNSNLLWRKKKKNKF
jgi:hypothetical protein